MLELLHSLENERAIYANLVNSGRNDVIATMLLQRIAKQIRMIEDKIDDHKRREESVKHRRSRAPLQNVRKAVHRLWDYKNRWYSGLLQISTEAALEQAEATQ